MDKIKTFKIEQKFSGTDGLYSYLLSNVEFIGESMGIRIEGDLEDRPFCITGKEKVTERRILFFASKGDFYESLGELIVLADAFDVDIIVFFVTRLSRAYEGPLGWLQRVCNEDTQVIVGEVEF